jgi:hypothetical protein
MSYTYSQPLAGVFPTLKDEVRFLAQDTIETVASVSDEEIVYLLGSYNNQIYITASQLAATIAMKYGKEAAVTSRSVGDLSISVQYSETAKFYQTLADKLKLGKQDNSAITYFINSPSQFEIGQFDELVP